MLDTLWLANDFNVVKGLDNIGVTKRSAESRNTLIRCTTCGTSLITDHVAYGGKVVVTQIQNFSQFQGISTAPTMPVLVRTGDTYENEFNFCTYNEGKGEADFAAFQSAHTDFVNGYEAERGPSAYGYALITPTFETDPMPDFVWLDLWASAEEKADGVGYFEGSVLQMQLADMATCSVVGFAGLNISS